MTTLSLLATFVGVIMAVSSFFQAYKIFKRKSAKDISVTTYFILIFGSIIWVFYGIEINSFPVIIPNTVGVFGSLSVISGWYLYGRNKRQRN